MTKKTIDRRMFLMGGVAAGVAGVAAAPVLPVSLTTA